MYIFIVKNVTKLVFMLFNIPFQPKSKTKQNKTILEVILWKNSLRMLDDHKLFA